MFNNPWEKIPQPSHDLSARRIDADHKLDLFWGRDHQGNYLFVYSLNLAAIPEKINLPNMSGIQTVLVSDGSQESLQKLVIILHDRGDWELFLALCLDLVSATKELDNDLIAFRIVLRRLERWQEFLKKNPGGLLTEEKIKGLIGELHFILKYLIPKFGAADAIKFWQGPEGLAQDFNVNNCAIEVKCQSGVSLPQIKISSLDQLCPQLPQMFVHVLTLGQAATDNSESISLPQIIQSIQGLLEQVSTDDNERFEDLLFSLGYVYTRKYEDFRYVLTNERTYKIEKGFPRICPNNVGQGISKVSYCIDLAEIESFAGRPSWMAE